MSGAALDVGPSLIADWAAKMPLPPLLTVSEWADTYRMLPEKSAARGGRWRTASTPYLRGIMDAILEPGVRKIAVMKAAQVGGSEAMHNQIAYFIAHDPSAMLLIHPTQAVAEEWAKDRLDDMLRQTPALEAAVTGTLDYKEFPGGFLAIGGANTPNTFARRSVRYVFGDDVDRWPPVVGEEGDPADLLEARTTTYVDGVVLLVSTPTLKNGRIDTHYQRSDRRRFLLTCPSCGHQDWITWKDPTHFWVGFENADPVTARLVCPNEECQARHDEPTRREMIASGFWQPTAASQEAGLVGFHLPVTYSTLGEVTLQRLVEQWLSARDRGRQGTRAFINTKLAEGWEERGARMNPHLLESRKADWGEGVEVPKWAVALTAGVDVQADRFEVMVTAWGSAMERAVVDWHTVPGDPKRAETRAALADRLTRKYVHATGHQLPIHAVCVDTGYATEEMYDFVLQHQARRVYATKGYAGRTGEPIVGKPAEKTYGRNPRPVRLYPVNVDDAKSDVMSALDNALPGPASMHFAARVDTIDEECFAQLCAEHRETRYNRLGVATHQIWIQDRDRNEALDCAVLCLAAFKLFSPNIRQMLEALAAAGTPAPPTPAPAAPPAPEPPKPPKQRQHSQSSYLR